ncbi:MAG TPA: peptide chain release factor 1 [Candidatus Limnocylindria bacterium]|nr:peptide chain release factor 1 [Candidatus Limnocylindria bacterium]
MIDRLREAEARHDEISRLLSTPDVARDPGRLQELGRELSRLEPMVTAFRTWRGLRDQLDAARQMTADPDADVAAMARDEAAEVEARLATVDAELRALLVPRDPNDERDVIVEVRAGAGGDEAAIFAADLFRMYVRYAERRRWKTEVLTASESDGGGLKEVIAEIHGDGAYSRLKWESGVHRVQRVPTTESAGRIHTSTATVSVLPEAEEVDLQIDEKDLRIDVYRSSGPGGQSVNTTDSAVRITHLPTGTVVAIQDEKSQHKNKAKALAVLRARLFEAERQRLAEERGDVRRSQVGTGERAEKIRTYNFPDDRITDHRIGLTVHNLPGVLEGDLDRVIEPLAERDREDRLGDLGA